MARGQAVKFERRPKRKGLRRRNTASYATVVKRHTKWLETRAKRESAANEKADLVVPHAPFGLVDHPNKSTGPDYALNMRIFQFCVVGRAKPTTRVPTPVVYRMHIFSRNKIVAMSKFWSFIRRLKKLKSANGEILKCTKILEENPSVVKNFAVWLRYDSNTGTHNMYKEYRDTTASGAVGQMYQDVAGNHGARSSSIAIMKVAAIPNKLCKRVYTLQMHKSNLRFPKLNMRPALPPHKRPTFCYKRDIVTVNEK